MVWNTLSWSITLAIGLIMLATMLELEHFWMNEALQKYRWLSSIANTILSLTDWLTLQFLQFYTIDTYNNLSFCHVVFVCPFMGSVCFSNNGKFYLIEFHTFIFQLMLFSMMINKSGTIKIKPSKPQPKPFTQWKRW